ncbi:MAG: hypothetical protein NZL87_02420, partial [Thermomicrobium sp.]|nr:hypothetical protein [Thermomicrobium sp.]
MNERTLAPRDVFASSRSPHGADRRARERRRAARHEALHALQSGAGMKGVTGGIHRHATGAAHAARS